MNLLNLRPHWLTHPIAALAIMAIIWLISRDALAGAVGGSLFYVGREIAQWEESGKMDWAGWILPTIAVFIVWLCVP